MCLIPLEKEAFVRSPRERERERSPYRITRAVEQVNLSSDFGKVRVMAYMYANVSDQFGRVRILRDAVTFRRDRNAAINPSSNNSDIQLI